MFAQQKFMSHKTRLFTICCGIGFTFGTIKYDLFFTAAVWGDLFYRRQTKNLPPFALSACYEQSRGFINISAISLCWFLTPEKNQGKTNLSLIWCIHVNELNARDALCKATGRVAIPRDSAVCHKVWHPELSPHFLLEFNHYSINKHPAKCNETLRIYVSKNLINSLWMFSLRSYLMKLCLCPLCLWTLHRFRCFGGK